MCYYKHEGNFVRVGGDEREGDDARDEEERVCGSLPQAGEDAAEDEDEGTEHQGLLDGDDSSSSGYKRSRRAGQPIQVKSDGTKRFCRKVSSVNCRTSSICASASSADAFQGSVIY